jgi:hypothetical protein
MVGVRVRNWPLFGGLAIILLVAGLLVTVLVRRSLPDDGQAAAPDASTTTVASSPTSAGPAGDAATKALASYDGYWQAYVAAAANPGASTPDLAKYVADPLLTELRAELLQYHDQGIVYKGRPTWTPRVTSVNVSTRPYTASIEDCFDNAQWLPVFAKTGQSAAAPGQATRYVITTTVRLYDTNGWLVVDSLADRGRSC